MLLAEKLATTNTTTFGRKYVRKQVILYAQHMKSKVRSAALRLLLTHSLFSPNDKISRFLCLRV